MRTLLIVAVGGVLALHTNRVAAQSVHSGHGAHAVTAPAATAHYLTVNVGVSDTAIEPSVIAAPAGRPVQLLLRNRGSMEHHYRVVGLVPDEVAWIADGGASADASSEGHDHHDRVFVHERAASPAGIRPTGGEVHAYVSNARGLDVVLFTATQTGTFLVQCDLHPDKTATLTIFDASPPSATPALTPGPQGLTRALTRNLGVVDYPGAPGVRVEATYAPAEHLGQILGPLATAGLEPDRYIAVLLSELVHTASLPGAMAPPTLHVNGTPAPLIDQRVMADSVHHRTTVYRFARDKRFATGHQVMTLGLASGQEATWHLPLLLPDLASAGAPVGFSGHWAVILALLGGMLAAMWPCLFQLTVYFIPALAGVAMQDGAGESHASRRRQVLAAAFYFILGFTLLYTATGALIGYGAQRLGGTGQFEAWQRYLGTAAGIVVIGLAFRVAAKVRAPLVCRMPVLSRMAHSGKPATRLEMMVAGLAFATGCMTCFGSALVVGMVVYVGLAQSALYGALVLFIFSLGMGIPLVIAAVAMARALPLLLKLENAVPWMGLISACLMAGFGVLLISGNYMILSEWTYRIARGGLIPSQ